MNPHECENGGSCANVSGPLPESAKQLPGLRGPVIAAALGLAVTGCESPGENKIPPGSVLYGSPAMMKQVTANADTGADKSR
jgi:hypothetical protein